MIHHHRPTPRSGIALVMAMAVLVLLIIMGLPFLLSQSSGIAGSKAYEDQARAIRARDDIEALGLGMTAEVMAGIQDPLLNSPSAGASLYSDVIDGANQWLALAGDSATDYALPVLINQTMEDPSTARIDLPFIQNDLWGADSASIGGMQARLLIQDESGKIDINSLVGAGAFDDLLELVDIKDWDDGDQHQGDYTSRSRAESDLNDAFTIDGDPTTPIIIPLDSEKVGVHRQGNNRWWRGPDDPNTNGELAEAIALDEGRDEGSRVTSLLELTEIDPGHNQNENDSFGLRKPLTPAEIDRLRPFVTTQGNGQSRQGQIDIGTKITHADESLGTGRIVEVLDVVNDIDLSYLPGPSSHDLDQNWWRNVDDGKTQDPDDHADDFGVRVGSVPQIINYNVLHPTAHAYLKKTFENGTSLPALVPNDLYRTYRDLDAAMWQHAFPPLLATPQIAIGLRSWGQFGIDSSVLIRDDQGRESGRSARRIVAQAVPPDVDLVHRWTTQADFHLLRLGRTASHVTSWPRALERFTGHILPDESATAGSGIAPAALVQRHPDWRFTPHLDDNEWQKHALRVYAEGTDVPGNQQAHQIASDSASLEAIDADDPERFTPDGIRLSNNDHGLAYHTADSPPFSLTRRMVAGEIGPHHLAMELRFDGDLPGDEHITLWEWRGALQNRARSFIDRDPNQLLALDSDTMSLVREDTPSGNLDQSQHLYRLEYRTPSGGSGVGVLALVICTGSVMPPLGTYGPDVQLMDSPTRNASGGSTSPLAVGSELQRIEHHIVCELESHVFHRIDCRVLGSAPGEVELRVDGIFGRDLTSIDPQSLSTPITSLQIGDRYTLPMPLWLQDDIDSSDTELTAVYHPIAGLPAPTAWLRPDYPGMLLIADGPNIATDEEYVRYRTIDTTGASGELRFIDVRRGQRDTDSEDHSEGVWVLPGGFHDRRSNTRLASGFWQLADPMVATRPSSQAGGLVGSSTATIPLTDGSEFPEQGGFVYIWQTSTGKEEIVYYDQRSANDLIDVVRQDWFSDTPRDTAGEIFDPADGNIQVALISQRISSHLSDPMASHRVRAGDTGSGSILLQLSHPDASGISESEIEWILVDNTASTDVDGDGIEKHFFVRTDTGIIRDVSGTYAPDTGLWDSGTYVLPVHISERPGERLVPGDIVTFHGDNLETLNHPSIVRHVSGDFFSLMEQVPEPWSETETAVVAISSWPGWNGGNDTGIMPRNVSLDGGQGLFYVGHADHRSGRSSLSALPVDLMLDGIAVTDTPHRSSEELVASSVTGTDSISVSNKSVIETAGSLFGSNDWKGGFLSIDGEIFAYERKDDPTAADPPSAAVSRHLIARGLFGTGPIELDPANMVHTVRLLPELGRSARVKKVEASGSGSRLELHPWDPNEIGPGPPTAPNEVVKQKSLLGSPQGRPPVFIAYDTETTEFEVLQLINEGVYWYTAPWLRGMYNTPIFGSLEDKLVFQYAPRYASLFRNGFDDDSPQEGATWRSRNYAFTSFPMSYHRMRFDPNLLDGIPWEISENRNDVPYGVERQERFLSSGHAWQDAPETLAGNGTYNSMEARVGWSYTDSPASAYPNSASFLERWQTLQTYANGRPPRIEQVYMRARSGIVIHDIQDGR